MTTFRITGNPGSPKRFGHGRTFTYLFHTPSGNVMLSCVYDSTRFASPGLQIIHENASIIEKMSSGQYIFPVVGFISKVRKLVPYRKVVDDLRYCLSAN